MERSPSVPSAGSRLETIVRGALRPLSLGLAGLYAFYAVWSVLQGGPGSRLILTVAVGSVLLYLAFAAVAHRWGSAHLALGLLFLPALVNCMVALAFRRDPAVTTHFSILIVAAGLCFLSLPWAVAAMLAALAGWGFVAAGIPDFLPMEQISFSLLPATGAGLIIAMLRIRVYRRFGRLQSDLERKAEDLSGSEQRHALAMAGSNDGLYDWDLRQDRVHYSERWLSILGLRPDQVGESLSEIVDRIHPDDADRVHARLIDHLKGDMEFFEDEFRMCCSDGAYRWVLVRGASIRDATGRAVRMAGSFTDMTHRGVFDPLTGLPNRRLLVDRLHRLTARPSGEEDNRFAVLFLDLDDFKIVNDTLGHQAGDDLLMEVAARLQTCVRASDTVARMGGDEFVVLLEKVNVPDGVRITLDRIEKKITEPFLIEGRELFLTVSIGAVIDTQAYDSPNDILRDADTAMYRAKDAGTCCVVFDVAMREQLTQRLRVEGELRHALREGQFVLHYQKIVELATGKLEGFEALVRWNHPERGVLPPSTFMSVMEETGLVVPLGLWTLREACTTMGEWLARHPELEFEPSLSVNLSSKQLAQDDLIVCVRQILEETGFDPTLLRIEVTESAIIEHPRRAAEALRELQELGVRILMDDFGTGHSSLGYLQTLPINTLKIDRSFIARMTRDPESSDLVRTIITMASSLGITVVAEGVETSEQARLLADMDCASGQGFLFAEPADLDSIPQGGGIKLPV